MREIITNLYANENFPIYLGAIILVLLVAFFIVFFLGKKDQKKIEMTQKLEAINADAFKNISAVTPVEAPAVTPQNVVTNNQMIQEMPTAVASMPIAPEVPDASVNTEPISAPITEPVVPVSPVVESPVVSVEPSVVVQQPEMEMEPVVPFQETPTEPIIQTSVIPEVPEVPITYPSVEPVVTPLAYSEPTVEPVEVINSAVEPAEKPVPKFNPNPVIEPYIPEANLSDFENLASSISNELAELEKQQEIAKPITQAVNNENSIPEVPVMSQNVVSANPTKVMTGVFSSVYAPKKEEPLIEDTMEIELPKLKESPVLIEEKEESLKL